MLRQAAVQLRDQHNNPSRVAGVKLRWSFQAAPGEDGEDACEQLPELCNSSSSQLTALTDERGRAFFGEIGVLPETGRLVRVCRHLLLKDSHRHTCANDGALLPLLRAYHEPLAIHIHAKGFHRTGGTYCTC
jgi:hypothetical protein